MLIEITCVWCSKKVFKKKRYEITVGTCSRSCRAKWSLSLPGVREKISKAHRIPDKIKSCEWCGGGFSDRREDGSRRADVRFCSLTCKSKWVSSQPEALERMSKLGKLIGPRNSGRPRPDASERMKTNNPMSNPETVEKMRQKMVGRTFLSRGGNGKLTEPQMRISNILDFPMEYRIKTAPVKDKFVSLPNTYSVDLAHVPSKTAVEVDGESHKRKLWRFLDKRKTEVLEALGWTVVRIPNQEVMEHIGAAVGRVCDHICKKISDSLDVIPDDWCVLSDLICGKWRFGDLTKASKK